MSKRESPPTFGRVQGVRPAPPRLVGVFSALALGAALVGALGGCGQPLAEEEGEDTAGSESGAQAIRIELPPIGGGGGGGGGGGSSGSKAEISLDSQLVFFSQVCAGASAKKILVLRNKGEDPLVVRRLEVEGKPFALEEAPKLPKTLKTGERLELTVKFSPPANRPDQLDQLGTLRITSNDMRREVTTIQLRGLLPPPHLTFSPRQIDLGDLDVGEVRTRRVTLRNAGACAVHIAGYETSGTQDENVMVDDLRVGPLNPGHTDRINLTGLCGRRGELNVKIRIVSPSSATLATAYMQALCD